MKLPSWLGHIVAFILSVLAGFFGTFNVLFSDVLSDGTSKAMQEMAGAVLYIFVVYFVFSSLLHWLWRTPTKKWMWWLLIPGGLFGALISVSDFSRVVYPLSVLAAMVLGTWLGWLVLKRRAVV